MYQILPFAVNHRVTILLKGDYPVKYVLRILD